MATLTTGMLIVLLLTGGITALAMLSVFANVIGHETQLHDLRNRVKELHFQHAMYLAQIEGRISNQGDVEIIEDCVDQNSANQPAESINQPIQDKAQSLPDLSADPDSEQSPIAA
jgi:hypothetical protein